MTLRGARPRTFAAADSPPGPLAQELTDLPRPAEHKPSVSSWDDNGVGAPLLAQLGAPQFMEDLRACVVPSVLDALVTTVDPDIRPLPVTICLRRPPDDGASPNLAPLHPGPLGLLSPVIELRG